MSYSAPVSISETALKTLVFAVTFDCLNLCLLIMKKKKKRKENKRQESLCTTNILPGKLHWGGKQAAAVEGLLPSASLHRGTGV